jgi:20S proteasome alpha/beta subunit
MTLIVALKYKDGTILSSDRRILFGPLKRDLARKLEPLGKNKAFGIAGAGLMGAMDEILENLKNQLNIKDLNFSDALNLLKELTWNWYCNNIERFQKDDSGFPTFIFVSSNKIARIFPNGYSEEANDYACEGSGRLYAEYILHNSYETNLSEEEAKELALYTIIETSKMDPSVGEDVDILIFMENGYKEISEEEIENIKMRITPLTRRISKKFERIIEKIMENRKNIRALSKSLFGFELFLEDEEAIWRIMKPCKTEEDFILNICGLSILIDKINVSQIKQKYKLEKIEGSIDALCEFLKREFSISESEINKITSILKSIKKLRSKKEPIHPTQPEFLQIIISMGYPYPPNWTNLWIDLLNKFNECLESIRTLLQYKLKTSN